MSAFSLTDSDYLHAAPAAAPCMAPTIRSDLEKERVAVLAMAARWAEDVEELRRIAALDDRMTDEAFPFTDLAIAADCLADDLEWMVGKQISALVYELDVLP